MTPVGGRPLVIQTEHLDEEAAAWLAGRAELVRCPSDEDRFWPLLERADALVIRTYTRVDGSLLSRAPRLRAVGRAGVGLDNVDSAACAARQIKVFSTPDANTRAVIEYVTALVLDAIRPRPIVERAVPIQEWKAVREAAIAPRQLSDLTVGIVGLGRIGSGVARVAAAMQSRVLYHDLLEFPPDRRFGAAPVSLETLLAESDIVTLHVDGRAANRGLIGAAQLAIMKPDSILVNTCRGFVIDASALAAHLRRFPGAQAILDVHEPEPFDPSYPLLGLPNARLLPHIAAATRRAHRNMSWVVKDVWEAIRPAGAG